MAAPIKRYYDRDLSWLSFNHRVMQEARDTSLPLYERLKFIAIYSSNLDEFYQVRVATLQSLRKLKKKKKKALGLDPAALIDQIHEVVHIQQSELGDIFNDILLPELKKHGIRLLRRPPEEPAHIAYLDRFFNEQVLPSLHPTLLAKDKVLHFMRNRALYLAVSLRDKSLAGSHGEQEESYRSGEGTHYGMVQIPVHHFSRFISLPRLDTADGMQHHIVFLDDVVKYRLEKLYPGYDILESYSIKLSRDAALAIEDEFSGNLVEMVQKNLVKRQVGAPSRFLYDREMPLPMAKLPQGHVSIGQEKNWWPGGRYHNMSDFLSFPNPLSPELESPPRPQLSYTPFDEQTSMINAIAKGDHLLHFPYQSYDYVLRFFNEAATDPQVSEIMTTQYRVASNSAIVNALIRAAENGKNVTVFVEIKARFDEAHNLQSAIDMERAGVRILYTIPGEPFIKVHAKVGLVMREEGKRDRGYAFLSTGNFNEKTARIYADHGLFTANQDIISELRRMFLFLSGKKIQAKTPFRQLLVAKFNIMDRFREMIDREISHARSGKTGYILIKVNNLEHRPMIEKLYEASRAGVQVDMIVRSVCCLRPGVKGLSENIRIIRIVGKYLEHARVFYFYNQGADELYMGSADWMTRNLERRVEVVFPLKKESLKSQVLQILQLQLQDNTKSVRLDSNIRNHKVRNDLPPVEAQEASYDLIKRGFDIPSRMRRWPLFGKTKQRSRVLHLPRPTSSDPSSH